MTPKIVTFYSYKGGVGRTMALVNTGFVLARDGWRVLMVDFDLEAPGMTHFFADIVRERPQTVQRDALDLLLHAKHTLGVTKTQKKAPALPKSLSDYVVNVGLPREWQDRRIPYRNGRLDLLPATLEPIEAEEVSESDPTHDYVVRIDKLDLPAIFAIDGPRHRFGYHVREYFLNARFHAKGDVLFTIREQVRAAYDIVLIDSRTGLNEISGLCIGPICDALVICSGLNRQNIYGIRYFMDKSGMLDREKGKPYIVVAGPVPLWHTKESETQMSLMRQQLRVETIVEVPYHPAAALTETVFVTQEPKDPISKAYEELAPAITNMLSVDRIEPRERLIDLSQRTRLVRNGLSLRISTEVAKEITLSRLQGRRTLPAPPSFLSQFPSACTLLSLPTRGKGDLRWEDVEPIMFAAGVSAYRLKSEKPFRRAWKLLTNVVADEVQNDLAIRLIFMQLQLLGTFPDDARANEAIVSTASKIDQLVEGGPQVRRTRTPLLDALATVLLSGSFEIPWSVPVSVKTIHKCLRKLSRGSFREFYYHDRRFREIVPYPRKVPLGLIARFLRMGFYAGKKSQLEERERVNLRRAVTDIKIRVPLRALREDTGFLMRRILHPVGLTEISSIRERAGGVPPPLGSWTEPLMATALALAKGERAIEEILGWLVLARMSYGYAWRVLVDWRHLGCVTDHAAFVQFLRQEDECAEEIESRIDKGEYAL